MGNKLVIIGNGFDLAHGLKTTYGDFINWYMVTAFKEFCKKGNYSDLLIELSNKYAGYKTVFEKIPNNYKEVVDFMRINSDQSLNIKSIFFQQLINSHSDNRWVDIEIFYFQKLKKIFFSSNEGNRETSIKNLNIEFAYLKEKLGEYLREIDKEIPSIQKLDFQNSRSYLKDVMKENKTPFETRFLNFNYTNTLVQLHYAYPEELIHIHGTADPNSKNSIIFGYGDESDPDYQKIEDSGNNDFLDHIKSFGYFLNSNYHDLLSFLGSRTFVVYIVGHSCGLSDRVLLRQIFEHENCTQIEVFYHKKDDGSDNFTTITHEISRQFKPQNKDLMRKKIKDKGDWDFIPQNQVNR